MTTNDLVIYYTVNHGPRLAQFVRYTSDNRAVIRLAGVERSVHVRSLRAVGGEA